LNASVGKSGTDELDQRVAAHALVAMLREVATGIV
jgi:hypothetical protein